MSHWSALSDWWVLFKIREGFQVKNLRKLASRDRINSKLEKIWGESHLQLTPDNSNLQLKLEKVEVIGGKISNKKTQRENKFTSSY